jgi:hypothetical protein
LGGNSAITRSLRTAQKSGGDYTARRREASIERARHCRSGLVGPTGQADPLGEGAAFPRNFLSRRLLIQAKYRWTVVSGLRSFPQSGNPERPPPRARHWRRTCRAAKRAGSPSLPALGVTRVGVERRTSKTWEPFGGDRGTQYVFYGYAVKGKMDIKTRYRLLLRRECPTKLRGENARRI